MKGFFNKILRINLKTKTFKEETIPDTVYEAYLGGKGLGTYRLMKENPIGVDPPSPDNKLIFCTGPITYTRIYGSYRHGVFTKSPLMRGLGAIVGMELVVDRKTKQLATAFTKRLIGLCREKGLLMVSAGTHSNIIRPLMPLVITDEQLGKGLSIIEESLYELQ